jgi:hypothetical protein
VHDLEFPFRQVFRRRASHPGDPQSIWYSEFGFPNLATPAISSMPYSSAGRKIREVERAFQTWRSCI